MAEIFEAFHQLDSSATRRYGGTGLGLALVQKIVEAHDSQVQVTSEVGKGSCFEFSLPVYMPPTRDGDSRLKASEQMDQGVRDDGE
jgi:signal transduction histidine kinase